MTPQPTITTIIARHDAAQAEFIAAAKELATRHVGAFEVYALAETWRRDPDLALAMVGAVEVAGATATGEMGRV